MKKDFFDIVHCLAFAGIFVVSGLSAFSRAMAADTYQVDPVNSSVGFSVKHLTVSTVTGEFRDFSGTIQFDPLDPAAFVAGVDIKVASIDTRQPKRDEHLRSKDFFDAEKFLAITFKSKKLTEVKDVNSYTLTGDLTMHGVTKEISIPVVISGPVKSPMGKEVIGLSAETTINRQDFGVSWNKALDSGGYVVGDEVRVLVNIEAGK